MKTARVGLFLALVLALVGVDAEARAPLVRDLVYAYNGNHLVGHVVNIYGDKAEVRWERYNGADYTGARTYWALSRLSVESNCYGAVCLGGKVYVSHGGHKYVGTVQHVFENGRSEVLWELVDGVVSVFPAFGYWSADQLSYETSCLLQLCAGDQVYFNLSLVGGRDTDYVGTIDRFFTGGGIDHGTEGQGVAEITYERENGVAVSGVADGYWHTTYLHQRTAGDGRK